MPELLVELGFSRNLGIGLLVIENTLAVVMEPLMGGLSDQAKHWTVSRFPFIFAGVIFSSALFMIIPSIVTFFQPSQIIRSIFLLVVVGWALAMAVFRSPAIALLGKYAAKSELPSAASLLTLVAGIISAFRPISEKLLLSFGAIFSFSFGSLVLLSAVFILRSIDPPETNINPAIATQNSSGQLLKVLALLLGTGFGIAWGSRLSIDVFSKLLKTELKIENVDGMMFAIAILLAFAALPAGFFASKIGNRKAMIGGICTISILMISILFVGAKLPLAIVAIGALSLIINGAIPFALSLLSSQRSALATGMYFGGGALAGALQLRLFPELARVSPVSEVFMGTVAFLLAGACVISARR